MISLSSQATIYPEGIHSLDEADRRCRHMLCIRNCSFFPILVLLSLLVLFAASAVGDLTLTSSELKQTATVLVNDPFRSLQSLPGISASANNDFFAQFSVMGTPYEQVGVYLDDVLVPNLLHTIASFPDAPTLSLLTGNDVED